MTLNSKESKNRIFRNKAEKAARKIKRGEILGRKVKK